MATSKHELEHDHVHDHGHDPVHDHDHDHDHDHVHDRVHDHDHDRVHDDDHDPDHERNRDARPPRPPARGETRPRAATRRYWLFKSEPETYGFDRFAREGRTFWSGVRNYQARNLLRDEIQVGDGVLFYHSSTDPNVIAGIAKVTAAGYPDPTQFEPDSEYHDPASDLAAPRWFAVDIECVGPMRPPVTRERCKQEPALAAMMLLQRGSRLSVQPVTRSEWQTILALGGQHEPW